MPVRSLNSSVLKWPDAATVDRAVRAWAVRAVREHPDAVRIGYFGSYARGNWGVGSDVDLVIIVERSDLPFERRAVPWDTSPLPVPADVLVYTQAEWEAVSRESGFGRTAWGGAAWVYEASRRKERGSEGLAGG